MDETFDTLTSPMKSNVGVSSLIPSWMHLTWTAMTERTSTVILLNSSKPPQAPGKCQDFQQSLFQLKLWPTSLCKAFEDVSTRLVVHLLGAVEDIDRHADGPEQKENLPVENIAPPSKILCCLCFAGACRTLGGASHHQVERLRQGDVTPAMSR